MRLFFNLQGLLFGIGMFWPAIIGFCLVFFSDRKEINLKRLGYTLILIQVVIVAINLFTRTY